MKFKELFKMVSTANELTSLIEGKPYVMEIRIDRYGAYHTYQSYREFLKYLKDEYITDSAEAIKEVDITREQDEKQYFEAEYCSIHEDRPINISIHIFQYER